MKRLGNELQRLSADVKSETAVEFALIGSAFFLFVMAIFVISLDQFWQMTLDDAVRSAARQVQVGKVTTAAGFVGAVCGEFGVAAPSCSSNLNYDVQEAAYFVGTTGGVATENGTSYLLSTVATAMQP